MTGDDIEVELSGGFVNQVVRIGDTVHREDLTGQDCSTGSTSDP